ncbi:MAG: amino acid racemase [Roseovarius sp.]
MRRVVGVLGGMGPEATLLLQRRVMATVKAQDDADHLPLLIDMNPQVPSRIAHLIEGTGESPAPVLAEMARRLEAAGATALAMPCNTAHHYKGAIAGAVGIPFLDMVALSVSEAALGLQKGAAVGLLASPAVRRAEVFGPALVEAGLTALWPEDEAAMLEAIRAIKAAPGPWPEAEATLARAARELAGRGARALLVACSEFSLLSDTLSAPVPVIDTVDVLARAIHAHTTGEG